MEIFIKLKNGKTEYGSYPARVEIYLDEYHIRFPSGYISKYKTKDVTEIKIRR